MSFPEISHWFTSNLPAGLDPLTAGLWISVGVIAVGAVVARARARRAVEAVARTSPTGEAVAEVESSGWLGRIDGGFDRMVKCNGYAISPTEAIGIISLCAIGAALLVLALDLPYWAAGLAYLVGFGVPLVIFVILHRRWNRQIDEELPDFLFLLQKSVQAGLTFPQAIEDYVSSSESELSRQLSRAVERYRLGVPMVDALAAVAPRLRNSHFDLFVSVVTLQQQSGGDLPYLLEQLAISVRGRNEFRGYVRSATALGRISAVAMVLAFPAILVMHSLLETGYIDRFFDSTQGLLLFGVALLLEIIGIVWLWRILQVED